MNIYNRDRAVKSIAESMLSQAILKVAIQYDVSPNRVMDEMDKNIAGLPYNDLANEVGRLIKDAAGLIYD